jgi:hypothetical protein
MHASAVLQKLLRRSIPSIHLKRLSALTAIVGSALRGGRLTLSALARSLDSDCAVRHRVKRVDRMLGNGQLQQERLLIYRLLCDLLIGNRLQPVLIVDWSDLRPDRSLQLLRAAVWVRGFALPIYEEIHPIRLQHARRVQREFLLTLRMLLPEGARPIVVTDAGFRSPWFQEIERLGWHWVGRIRNRTMIEWEGRWQHCKRLYLQATAVPQDLGVQRITRANPITGRLSLYHKPPKGRHHITHYGAAARGSTSRKNASREREPWLIAAAVSLEAHTALDFINLYRVRMRIEHGFRTLKSHQFGFALEDSQSRSAERLAVLLLIHALALFLAWIAGWAAQRTGLHQQLKSNVDRQHRNFSIVTLGWMALVMIGLHLSVGDVTAALQAPPPLPASDQTIQI